MSEKKSKILMIAATPFFADRGCHIRIYNEIKFLTRRSFDVVLTTYHNGNTVMGVDTRRILNVPWYKKVNPGATFGKIYLDFLLFFTTLKTSLQFKPDIFHPHLYEGLFIAYLVKISTFSKAPIIFDFQGSLAEEMYAYHLSKSKIFAQLYYFFWLVEKVLLYIPDKIICSSASGADLLTKNFKVTKEITVVNDGFDLVAGKISESERNDLKQKLGIPQGNKVVIYTGSLSNAKGVGKYLEVIEKQFNDRNDITFLFVGYGPLQDSLKMENVIFTGQVSYFDLSRYLSVADVAIDPKRERSESSAKIMNYLMAGLPVVCFSVPIAELRPYVKVISDFDELRDAIDTISKVNSLPPELIEKYSNEKILEKLEGVYAQQNKNTRHRSKVYNFLFVFFVSLIFLYVFRKFSSASLLLSIVKKTDLALLSGAFVVYLSIYYLRAIRFSLVSPLKSVRDNFAIGSIHTFVNNVLPAETGEFTYPYLLKRLHKVSYAKSIADLSMIRLFDLANVFIFLAVGVMAFLKVYIGYIICVFFLLQILLVFLYYILIKNLNKLRFLENSSETFLSKVKNFIMQIIKHQSDHPFIKLLGLHLFSCVITLVMLFYGFILMKALGLRASFFVFLVGWCLSVFGSLLPIQSFFGFGSAEAGWMIPLVYAGLSNEFSLALSVNYHLISLAFSFILFLLGCSLVLGQKLLRNHRHIAQNSSIE